MKRLLCGWLIGESQLLIADWVGCEFVILANWFIDSMKGLLCRRCGLGWLWADDLGPLVRRWVIDSWGVMETMIEIVKKVYQASRKEEKQTSSNVLCSSLCLSMNFFSPSYLNLHASSQVIYFQHSFVFLSQPWRRHRAFTKTWFTVLFPKPGNLSNNQVRLYYCGCLTWPLVGDRHLDFAFAITFL